jgi:hypothetical protein
VICIGNEEATYNPALTNTPQDVHGTSNSYWDTCIGSPGITSGNSISQGGIIPGRSCNTLLDLANRTRVITWSNGDTSTFQYDRTSSTVNGNLVLTLAGEIIAGRFGGRHATGVITMLNINRADFATACANNGVSELSGSNVLTILPL